MKAGINGALNLSTLDGWWDEAQRGADASAPPIGWVIGDDTSYPSLALHDAADAASLYDLLEHEIVPAFYDRDGDGVPRAWLASLKESVATLGPIWTSTRMVREYTEHYYLPGRESARRLRKRKGARARDLAAYLGRARDAWPAVRVGPVDVTRDPAGNAHVRVPVVLGSLAPADVTVQVWLDHGDGRAAAAAEPMTPDTQYDEPDPPGQWWYRACVPASDATTGTIVAVRVLAHHAELDDPLSTGCLTWSE
jgi:starch phosphorylase